MIGENVEIVGSVNVADDVQKRIKTTGVRGLDIEKARELGLFQRIANLLCVSHATIAAAYRVYGGVDYLVSEINARKNDIAHEMNNFERAFDKFMKFWTDYYSNGKTGKEVSFETENLYHHIMEWMQMPESWQLGEPQRTDCDKELAIRIDTNEKVYTFHKASLNNEIVDSRETWGVMCYDTHTNKQTCVNAEMDKASALMVAKRLSNENQGNIYTASIIRDVVEKRTDVIPFKAFRANETIGKLVK